MKSFGGEAGCSASVLASMKNMEKNVQLDMVQFWVPMKAAAVEKMGELATWRSTLMLFQVKERLEELQQLGVDAGWKMRRKWS